MTAPEPDTLPGAGLRLTQWLSPAFPTGGFAWSHGLEQAVADGAVSDAESLADWAEAVLRHGAGQSDTILLAAAHRAPDTAALADLADLALALAPSADRRAETLEQGAAFARTLREVWTLEIPDMALPVAVGRATALTGEPLAPAARLYLQTMLTTLLQAAQRLMPLGQTGAQRLLARLTALVPGHVAATLPLTPDDIALFTPALDAAAMRAETLEPRIFRS
ncbi:urease accessory protein UreF [Histidinibacterium lentulum]|uniref:Urease accessory protein UreF n=2 Tax=Histidinibacterium lentulum TaxID=2480588 RepID=A0A3N2QV67_9RHOB|nr:urease accessory protein UreF [Histidinibacterium lentulum]